MHTIDEKCDNSGPVNFYTKCHVSVNGSFAASHSQVGIMKRWDYEYLIPILEQRNKEINAKVIAVIDTTDTLP